MSNTITIKSIKITNGMFLKVTYDELQENSVIDTLTRKSTAPVHDDLKAAMRKLDIHLALLCEEVEIEKVKNFDEVDKLVAQFRETLNEDLFGNKVVQRCCSFHVDSISTNGENLQESVLIGGCKTLSNLKSVSLTTPSTAESETYPYKFIQQLNEAVYILEEEVKLFLFEGKQAPKRQQELDFTVTEGDDKAA